MCIYISHIYLYTHTQLTCVHVCVCVSNPSKLYNSFRLQRTLSHLIRTITRGGRWGRIIASTSWVPCAMQMLQGPTGLQGVTAHITAPLSMVTQTHFMTTGQALPAAKPARTRSPGEPEASPAQVPFCKWADSSLGTTVSPYGFSVQSRQLTQKASLPQDTSVACIQNCPAVLIY